MGDGDRRVFVRGMLGAVYKYPVREEGRYGVNKQQECRKRKTRGDEGRRAVTKGKAIESYYV